jgi:hypothetical protein
VLLAIVPLALALVSATAVPPALSTLEHVAEAIDDAVENHDWVKVRGLVRDGESALAKLPGTQVQAGHDAMKALAEAKEGARLLEPMATRRAANRLAAAVVAMYEPFHPLLPTSVMRLDVLLREIQLAAIAGDLAEARPALEKASAIWASIATRPPLQGTHAARAFDLQLQDLGRAVAAGRTQPVERAAHAALEGVDAIEVLFERRPKPVP